jgi:uncharacterized protein (TIGR02453 family)
MFNGFTKQTIKFYKDLGKNNNKKWFNEQHYFYEQHVLNPAKEFVIAMGEALMTIAPKITAVPKVNQSIFRINRDVRFSKDKTPYKTHLGMIFWEGGYGRMESPSFYFHLEPPNLWLGGGIYWFPRFLLKTYRDSVVHKVYGKELADAAGKIEKKGYSVEGKNYSRIPGGYDPKHQNADFLLHTGLYASHETKIPLEFYSGKIVDYCLRVYKNLLPLHQFLLGLEARSRTRRKEEIFLSSEEQKKFIMGNI